MFPTYSLCSGRVVSAGVAVIELVVDIVGALILFRKEVQADDAERA